MHSAAVRQLNTPAGRRPHASDIQEHRNRPAIAATAIQIPSLDASVGVICSTITSRVTCQSASPTPPVWLRPVRAPAKMLRGYLKSSVQRVCSTAAATAGSSIAFGSICNAQASDRRASSKRPMRISQCGDSGTQARVYRGLSPEDFVGFEAAKPRP